MDADLVFDVRFLPNPHFVPRLRPKTGRDRAVIKFMEDSRATGELLARLNELLKFLIPQYVAEGKSYLTIAIGCTGGRHRSVMIAEALRRRRSAAWPARACGCTTGILRMNSWQSAVGGSNVDDQ